MPTDISVKEQLEREEELIESHIESFHIVGQALARIRDSRLYLVTHTNFEKYVKERWNKSKGWAFDRILDVKIGEVGRAATSDGKPVLRTRAHKRALQAAPSEQRKTILEEAVAKHGPKMTAKQLEKEVESKRKKAVERDPIPDEGTDITKHVQAAMDSVPRFSELRHAVTMLHKEIENLSAEDWGAFLLQEMSQVTASCNTLKDILKFSAPYADCVLCTQQGCKVCRNTGWVTKLLWDKFPEANKKRSFVHCN